MAPRKIHLHQGKNPLDAYPFEAFSFGSWKPAKFIKIESGNVTLHFMDDDEMVIQNGYSDMRIKSRNASLSDCTSFLRQGIDVCVLSTFQSDDSDQLKSNPVWADAKITSVDRKPHKPDCSCEYYVNFYDNQGSLGSEKKTLSKEVKVIGLDRISILQKLGRKGHDNQPYQWDSSEDCIARSLTKLFLRNFACDISWLVVASLKKNVSFCVRSVDNKILYQILETDSCSSNDSNIRAVNFRLEDGIFFPSVFDVDFSDTKRIVPSEHDSQKVPPSVEGLRRSTRRIKAPERYLGYDLCSGSFRTQKCKIHSGKDDAKWCSSGRYYNPTSRKKHQRKDSSDLDDMMDLQPGWKGQSSRRGAELKRYRSDYSRNMNDEDEEQPRRGRALDATASKKMIDSYMKSMNKIPTKEEVINEQWKEAINFRKDKDTEKTQTEEEEVKISEMEMLWREMDEAMTEIYLEKQTEGSNVAASAQTKEESTVTCKHNYIVDEQIGERCTRCGFVKTEIKYIFPPFMERRSWRHEERQCIGEEPELMADDGDVDLHLFPTPAACDEPISNETNNVWALIPELREKMHLHQKKAFEFLWQNIGGSMDQGLMEAQSESRGGCVISHSPGAGKTLLMIAFLVSYLKLFPQKRPLILAPKTTLYTWNKEFIKWQIHVPVYLINSRKDQRNFSEKALALPGLPNPTEDVKHTLDCLDKIQKWQAHPCVLVMGYTSFLSLMNEDSKFEHKSYMAKALRESPGILILDEGHNPRSTKSRLREALMKVETELRILLSGTLFQNNICEYFNTLCLARPRFIHEVLNVLDPTYVRSEAENKAPHIVESRARKFFLDIIGAKIDSVNAHEKMEGINMLKSFTSGFIDVYDSEIADSLLPGLQIYTLLMNNTVKQSEILQKLQKKMNQSSGYPLEVEFLITLASIHPWLITTTECAKKFFSLDQLKQLDKCKDDMKIGSKVKFVLSLVLRVTKKEKVLIFCRNLAPMWLLLELFEKFFM